MTKTSEGGTLEWRNINMNTGASRNNKASNEYIHLAKHGKAYYPNYIKPRTQHNKDSMEQ